MVGLVKGKGKGKGELQRAMRESLRAYSSGDRRFFDFLSSNVRVYNVNSSEPVVGRKAFESAFAPTFKAKRKVAVIHQDLQLSGAQAVLSQTLQVTVKGVSSNVRQTVVWEQSAGGEWQMSHIHNAMVGQPVVSGAPPKNAAAIKVINERIATAAATVGVAQ